MITVLSLIWWTSIPHTIYNPTLRIARLPPTQLKQAFVHQIDFIGETYCFIKHITCNANTLEIV